MDLKKFIIPNVLSVSERNEVNRFLENLFNQSNIKRYLSNIYPEIYPNHVGLILDIDGKFKWGFWEYNHFYDGYYEKGWNFDVSDKVLKYVKDIKEFYKENNIDVYDFLEKIGK